MAVLTRQEYEQRKTKNNPVKKETVKVKSEIVDAPKTLTVLYVYQDPETRTFKDKVKINGREIERVCNNGILRTEDKDLASFLSGKGWLLLDTLEGRK